MDIRILWLTLGAFTIGIDGFIVGSLLPSIAAETHSSVAQAGYVAFAFSLWGVIGNPVLLAIIGGEDCRLVLSLSVLVFAVGALLMALLPGLALIILGRLVIAAGAGVYTSMGQATAMALVPPDRRGRALTTVLIGTSAAVALGVPGGAWIAGALSWRTTYLMIAGLGLVSAAMLWVMLPNGMSAPARSLKERIGVIALPGVPILLATTSFMMFGAFMVPIYVVPLTTSAGLTKTVIPVVLFAYGLGAVAANVWGGRVIDRIGGYRTAASAGIAQAAVLLVIPLAAFAAAAVLLGAYCVLIFAASLAGWLFHAAQITRIAGLAGGQAPLALSLNGSAINVGSGLAAIVGGIVLERLGPNTIPWVAAIPCVVALGIMAVSRPRPVLEAG